MGDLNRQEREARSRMEAAERQSERQFSAGPARPRRYRLYDRIARNVSVSAMNVIIATVAALLVLALIIGIATGNPR